MGFWVTPRGFLRLVLQDFFGVTSTGHTLVWPLELPSRVALMGNFSCHSSGVQSRVALTGTNHSWKTFRGNIFVENIAPRSLCYPALYGQNSRGQHHFLFAFCHFGRKQKKLFRVSFWKTRKRNIWLDDFLVVGFWLFVAEPHTAGAALLIWKRVALEKYGSRRLMLGLIARGGRAVEVGPLRLHVVLPG